MCSFVGHRTGWNRKRHGRDDDPLFAYGTAAAALGCWHDIVCYVKSLILVDVRCLLSASSFTLTWLHGMGSIFVLQDVVRVIEGHRCGRRAIFYAD